MRDDLIHRRAHGDQEPCEGRAGSARPCGARAQPGAPAAQAPSRGPKAAAADPEAGVRSPGVLPFFCSCSWPVPLWASAIHRRWAPGAPANDQELRAGVKEERGNAYQGDPRTPGRRTGLPQVRSAPGRKRAGTEPGAGRGAPRSPSPPPPRPLAHLRPVCPGRDFAPRPLGSWREGSAGSTWGAGTNGQTDRPTGVGGDTEEEATPGSGGWEARAWVHMDPAPASPPPSRAKRGPGPQRPDTAQAPDRALAGTPSARVPHARASRPAPRRVAGPDAPRWRAGPRRLPRGRWGRRSGAGGGATPAGEAGSVLRSQGGGGGLLVRRGDFGGRGGGGSGGAGTWRGGGAAAGKVLLLGKSGDSSSASSGLARQGRAPRAGGEWAPTGDRRTGSSCFCGGLGAPSSRSPARGGPTGRAGSGFPTAPAPSSRGRAAAADRGAGGGGGGGRPAAAGGGGAAGAGRQPGGAGGERGSRELVP